MVLSLSHARACGHRDIVLTGKLTRTIQFARRFPHMELMFSRGFTIPEHAAYARRSAPPAPADGRGMASEAGQRVSDLDLTDQKGAVCGKMFADMVAEVIKVEPPAGCTTRRIPPFWMTDPVPITRCTFGPIRPESARVTLNLDCAAGRRLLIDLAAKADFLVESYPDGYLEALGLGYEALAKVNPRLIYTSIIAFGDRAPGKDYQAADINIWAAGGAMYLMGEEDRPPLQISAPQAFLHAGAEASAASLIAHYPRRPAAPASASWSTCRPASPGR